MKPSLRLMSDTLGERQNFSEDLKDAMELSNRTGDQSNLRSILQEQSLGE